uniref:Uncharacterized protein n=1 Tax=Ditylenchus dipsaci TaxID=166011 RepID=A0A915DKU7_9BILA
MWTYWLHLFLIACVVLVNSAAIFCAWDSIVKIFRFLKRVVLQISNSIARRKIRRSDRTSMEIVFAHMLKQEISPIEPFMISSALWFSSPSNADLDKNGKLVKQLVPENQALAPSAAEVVLELEDQRSAAIDRLFRHKKAFFQNCEYEGTIARAFTRKTDFKEITADEGQTTRSSHSHRRPSAIHHTVQKIEEVKKEVASREKDVHDLPIEMNEVDSEDKNVQKTQSENTQIEKTQND